MITDLLKGVWVGNSPVNAYYQDQSLARGHEWFGATFVKVTLVSALLSQIELQYPLSNWQRVAVYALPCAVGAHLAQKSSSKRESSHPLLRQIDRAAYFLHRRLAMMIIGGTLLMTCKTLSSHRLRSMATLATFTSRALAIWPPLKSNHRVERTIARLTNILNGLELVGAFCAGGAFNYLFYTNALIGLGLQVAVGRLVPPAGVIPPAPILTNLALCAEDLEPATDHLIRGVHATPVVRPEGVSIGQLQTAATTLEEDPSQREAICEAIRRHPRFEEDEGYGEQDAWPFFTDGINAYVSNIREGSCTQADLLLTYALILSERASQLQDQPDNLRILLTDIAVGGHECEEAWLYISKEIAEEHTDKGAPMEEQLLTAMARCRESRFQELCLKCESQMGFQSWRALSPIGLHNWNARVRVRGWALGLESYRTARLDRTIPDKSALLALPYMRTWPSSAMFMDEYTTGWIVQQMQKILLDSPKFGISRDRLKRWLDERFGCDVREHMNETQTEYRRELIVSLCFALGLLQR